MNCNRCSNRLPSTANFCNKCGEKVTEKIEVINRDLEKDTLQETVPKNLNTASQNKRFLNYIIDMICFYLLSIVVGYLLGYFVIGYLGFENLFSYINENILNYILFFLYYLLFEGLINTTPGKTLTKTKVVTYQGERPNFAITIGRSLSRLIPFDPLSFLTKNPNGWHDRISKTYVVPKNYTKEEIVIMHDLKTSNK